MNLAASARTRYSIVGVAAALVAMSFGAANANAALLATTTDCEPKSITHPFASWGDNSPYMLVPDGAVENGLGEWNLSGGSQIVDGNSPFYSNSSSDSHSLRIPEGGTATSGTMCIGREHPTMRFFAKNEDARSSYLYVQVQIETAWGREFSLPVGIERGNQAWEPSSTMRLIVNYLNLRPDTYTPVEFKFTARNGDWLIDDVYVDPRQR